METKTNQEWMELYPTTIILDADGWDRSNMKYSFCEEQITHEEFKRRLHRSTINLITAPHI